MKILSYRLVPCLMSFDYDILQRQMPTPATTFFFVSFAFLSFLPYESLIGLTQFLVTCVLGFALKTTDRDFGFAQFVFFSFVFHLVDMINFLLIFNQKREKNTLTLYPFNFFTRIFP